MILYKKKQPQKMSIGGWISDLGGGNETWTTIGNMIDPAGSALDVYSDPNASSSDMWGATFSMVSAGPGAANESAKDSVATQDAVEQEEIQKVKDKTAKLTQGKGQGAYANQADISSARADYNASNQAQPQTQQASNWYNA